MSAHRLVHWLVLPLLLAVFVCAPLLASPPAIAAEATQSSTLQLLQRRNVRFTHVDTSAGLSQDSVNAIVQDHQGFIWIGTQEGLNRYNGHDMMLFERDPFDEASLTHNWVFALQVAADGRLWIGTDGGGINIYNPLTERLTSIRHDPDNPSSLSSDRVRTIHQDRQGDYWIGTVNAGLNRIDGETGAVERYAYSADDPTSLPHKSVLTVTEDKQGRLWIGTDGGGLARYNRTSNSFVRYLPNAGEHTLQGSRVSAVLEDRDGGLWVGTRDRGLNRLDFATEKFQHYGFDEANAFSLSNNHVRDILEDQDGTLWVSTDNGLNEWREREGGFVRYYAKDNDNTSLSVSRLSDLYQSSDGVLWVGSYGGVNTWNYLSDAFTHYRKEDGALGADVVTSIAESQSGKLWIGTYGGGLTAIDRLSSRIEIIKHVKNQDASLSDNRVMAVEVDANGIVWAGTRADGLNRIDPTTGLIRRMGTPELTHNSVSSIHGDADGTLWVGTFGGGLNRIHPDGEITWYQHDPKNVNSLGGNRILAITRDKANTLWIGTEQGGLNRFQPETGDFKRYGNDPENPESLSSNAAWEVYETSDGSLWIATMNDGLNQWRPEDREVDRDSFRKWTKSDGLRSNTVYGLLEDDAGYLWLSSNRGISRLNLADKEVRHYDRRNGLVGDEFNLGARVRSRTGHLLFGGSEGVVSFVPGQIRRSEKKPPMVLSAYSPFERLAVRYSGNTSNTPALLDYTDNYVAFEFAALDYTSPDKNDFRYMLEGFDTDWQNPGSMRRITYANLSGGEYLFRVKAANSDDVWNEEGVVLTIRVEPAPWVTAWAYMFYTIILGVLALIALKRIQLRRSREAGRRAELERLVQRRTSELGERNLELEQVNNKLLTASFTDSLTGLYNRRYLDQFIDQQVAAVDRESHEKRRAVNADFSHYQQTVLFFMMIDLDGFKTINDTYGHAAGDKALLQVRDELVECTRSSDTIIRWGGDEFLIVGRTKGLSGIANFAERVRLAVSEHHYDLGEGISTRLSCSVGAVPYPLAPLKVELQTWEQALNLADAGAYIVKDNGRNGWLVISGSASIELDDALQLPAATETLVAEDKLQINTSLSEPVVLSGTRQAVA